MSMTLFFSFNKNSLDLWVLLQFCVSFDVYFSISVKNITVILIGIALNP
jgi:hypothetical protein